MVLQTFQKRLYNTFKTDVNGQINCFYLISNSFDKHQFIADYHINLQCPIFFKSALTSLRHQIDFLPNISYIYTAGLLFIKRINNFVIFIILPIAIYLYVPWFYSDT